MERPETESFTHLPPEVDTSQYIEQASVNPPGYQNLYGLNQDQRDRRPTNADWELKQLHLAFQDSHLSPVLPLLPSTSGVQQNITEYSLFHQSDLEFAPLRASPDISVTSERFHFLPQGHTSQASEHGSLSQHPLAQATVLTDDAASSCCSLSQHSMSPGDEGRKGEMVHSPVTDHLQEMHFSIDGTENNDGDGHGHALGNLSVKPMEEAPEEDTSFLRGDIPARQLLELLQKDVGMPSGSSSAVSSASETSLKRMGSFDGESKGVFNTDADQRKERRDSPTGTATLTQQQQTPQLKLKSQSGKSYPRLSDVSNITMGSRKTQPDDTSEALHREMLSEIERRNSSETGFKVQPLSAPTPNLESVTGKPNMARVILAGMCGTGPQFSGGYSVEHGLRQRGLLSLENQTGNDGSFLGFLPQSQSTPGVFHGPGKSRVKAPSDRLSAVESNMRASYESSSRVSQQSVAMPDIVSLDPVTSRHGAEKSCQEETGSGKVQGLPSLNYMQKVDAWRANQSSGKISLFDNLALQGFSGTSPKKNAYNAISDSLNHILLNQQEKTMQHKLPVSSTTNPSVTQSLALTLNVPPSSSSPRRGEAVGSAPNEMDNTGSGAGLSASSLSTVVTSIQKAQHKERLTKGEMSQIQERRLQQTSAVIQPSPLLSLGRFSDVSLDREVSSTLSNSQHSYHSGQNPGASIGVASSVVSLEVDNYAPYWSSIPSSPLPPHKPRELNIEERIPLYLHNLGIDQSPSTILTPFGPRGPIREPEFSPTDLCTIKGSIGTSPKSTQPSEGGTPHKADFSRYSLLSVDSSMSIPLSIDSLCQPIHFLEQARASPQSDVAGGYAAVPISQPQHAPYLPAPQPDQQQQRDDSVSSSQNTIQLGEQFVSESSLVTGCRESESHSQPSIIEKSNRDSFVGDKTLREIRKLLGQAGDVVSGGSSKASTPSSSSSATSHLHSDDDILLSLRKRTGGFMDSSLISSASGTEGPETRSSFLWTRSSSDSMLTSERQRESSIGRESMSSSGQPNYPSTLAPSSPPAVEAYIRPQDSTADGGAGLYLHLSKSVRRAEPEGCSAAPPDSTGPAQLPIVPQPPAVSQPQPALSPRETIGSFSEQEEEGNSQDGLYSQCVPTESVSSSSPPIPGEEQEAMSNASSSESSLAARVAKLLHNESPATLVSSRSSTTDQEESRAREWTKLKITGQQRDPLELDIEDRRRIEEIKREQKHPIQSQGSTDTESSAVSSMGGQGGQPPPQPAETATTLKTAEHHMSRQLPRLGANPFDSSVELHTPLGLDLESRVQEIAAREGLTLPRASPAPPALTSITISTCRRSTSPSPSPSPAPPLSPAPPEPLCLTQLSTANKQLPHVVEEDNATPSIQATHTDPVSIQPVLGSESTSRLLVDSDPNTGYRLYAREQNLSGSELIPRTHRRQDAIGGRNVESLQGQPREEEVKVRDSYTEAELQRDLPDANRTAQPEDQGTDQLSMMSDQLNSGSDMGLMTEQATGSSTVDAPTRTGHVSHIHLTLSPKAQEQRQDSGIQPRHAAAGPDLQSSKFYPLRYSSSPATRSGDEGLGLSSPLESYESRDVIRARVPERAETATLFKTMVHEGTETSTYPQSYIPPQRLAASTRPLAIPTPAVPVLLPYKPHGSEELFYVPQTEAQASPSRSDTTMESSHPGSDDAVPPYFSSEVLGKQDPGIDRGVSTRHVEGIYSKRLKTATFKMQPTGHSGGTVSVDGSSQTSMSQVTQPSSQVSEAFTRVPLSSNQVPSGSRRDRGTSPVQFLSYGQSERHSVEFQPIDVEMDSNTASQRPSAYLASDTVAAMEREQGRCRPDLPQPASRPSGSNLDQLWRKFNERWGSEERRPTSEREASLLDRLERLSRLIHSTAGVRTSSQPEDSMQPCSPHNNEDEHRKRGEEAAVKRRERKENVGPLERKSVSGEGGQRRGKPTAPRQAWTQEAEQQTPLAEDDVHSSFSPSRHRCPAERDESDTTSTLSGSMSTVDTARLIRAFGPDRVRCLKSASSLGKLYSTIDKQKEAKEPRRTREMDRDVTPPTIITPSETTVTDDSIVASDSASSTSTYTLPTRRGPSQSLAAKKSVKQVNKGIQAGDLEIVSNGTRRHTRDVGTTFPSPGEARGPRQLPSSSSSSSLERGREHERSPSKTQVFLKERKSKRSHGKHYPQGVTWFVPAEHLRSEARKENQPEEDEQWVQRPSSAWFQPYSRTSLWREPLRERQIQEEWNSYKSRPDPDPRDKTTSSGLVRVSLQEALELHRPTFIAHSRERMKRLALQAEERKLQVLFSREREQFYTRPGGQERLPRPAGIPLFRRAVPRKEMVQRSKQIYENLPEVQRRRDEQRRKAEYQSYRLNAQLFNKKVTNRVHGRQVPWH